MTTEEIDQYIVSWREAAACAERTNVDFFAEPSDILATSAAKTVCDSCWVAEECLTWAIETNQTDGIWGGYTAKERRSIRRRWLEEIRRAS